MSSPNAIAWAAALYFEGNNVDNDSIQDLLDLMENACVDPNLREERWGRSCDQ